MGTAWTMNAIGEALGMSLPGRAVVPAPYRERGHLAYRTGRRIVDMAYEDSAPVEDPDPRGYPQRDRHDRRDWRLNERPAAHRRDRPACRY